MSASFFKGWNVAVIGRSSISLALAGARQGLCGVSSIQNLEMNKLQKENLHRDQLSDDCLERNYY